METNVQERIRLLRKKLKLTQDEFSKKINISRSNLCNIENGTIGITNRVIADVCTIFNVSENWLRTGEGEMFRELKTEDYLIDAFGKLVQMGDGEFVKQLCASLAKLTPEQWRDIAAFAWEVVENWRKAMEQEKKD